MNDQTIDIIERLNEGDSREKIAQDLGITVWAVRKARQLGMDHRRINNGKDRKRHRSESAVEALHEQVLRALHDAGAKLTTPGRRGGTLNHKKGVAVIHLSDHHLNELISTPSNEYDFEVAAKRLALLADKTRTYCKAMGIQRVVVAFGGDLLNSDRRIDEVTNMATNRSRAMVLAVHLYRQFIEDMRSDFFVDCFGITGNEGRAKQELSFAEPGVSDSYDASIYFMLQEVMEVVPDKGLRFHALQGNEAVFTIHQETFLMLHGHQINMSDQRKVQSLIGKHSALNSTRITYILAGHIHSAMISDFCGRNSSMSGGNAYSEEALGFCSKASQNIHIVLPACKNSPAGLDGIKIDLQDVTSVKGYDIIKKLESHDARGSLKAAQAAINQPRRLVVVV
jgi:predicted phosphodiesterase